MSGPKPGRAELKYAVPRSDRDRIRDLIDPYVVPDPHARPIPSIAPNAWGYDVHSLYFDTPDLADYFLRLDNGQIRDRLRIRTYSDPGAPAGDDEPVILENKRKQDDRVVKTRATLCKLGAWRKTGGPFPWQQFLDNLPPGSQFTGRDFDRLVAERREPVSIVHYTREVYTVPGSTQARVRVTMDHNVTATGNPSPRELDARPTVALIPPEWIVLELKFAAGRPAFMTELTRTLRLRAEPISKFGLSVLRTKRNDAPREARRFTPRSVRKAAEESAA